MEKSTYSGHSNLLEKEPFERYGWDMNQSVFTTLSISWRPSDVLKMSYGYYLGYNRMFVKSLFTPKSGRWTVDSKFLVDEQLDVDIKYAINAYTNANIKLQSVNASSDKFWLNAMSSVQFDNGHHSAEMASDGKLSLVRYGYYLRNLFSSQYDLKYNFEFYHVRREGFGLSMKLTDRFMGSFVELNPLLGHLSLLLSQSALKDALTLSTLFEFNVYSFESSFAVGVQYTPLLTVDQVSDLQKDRISSSSLQSPSSLLLRLDTQTGLSVGYETRLNPQFKMSLGLISEQWSKVLFGVNIECEL
ncbi:hypothetical protein MP228_007624 [Amoeboaphelidium protococcarum]|nr:hypothetical protein MP228_007624 [Amoeboaphelidium protococcarum]